ncbi:unnamed protein product [Effrenium voratum]|nr:unnamed protein product [Effrenium voratum]
MGVDGVRRRGYVPPKMSDIVRGDWQEYRGSRIIRIDEVDGRLALEHQPPEGPPLILERNNSTAAVLISWAAFESDEVVFNLELQGDDRLKMKFPGGRDAVTFLRVKARKASRSCSLARSRVRMRSRTPASRARSRRGSADEHQTLVRHVKSLQSRSKGVNEHWQHYCARVAASWTRTGTMSRRCRALWTCATLEGEAQWARSLVASIGDEIVPGGARAASAEEGGGRRRHHPATRGGAALGRAALLGRAATARQSSHADKSSSSEGASSVTVMNPEQSARLAEAKRAEAEAQAEQRMADRALREKREALESELQAKLTAERSQHMAEAVKVVAAVEAEARREEEVRLKEAVRAARETREAKVAAAKKEAHEAAEEVVQQLEESELAQVRSLLAPLEEELASAKERVEQAQKALEQVSSEMHGRASQARQSAARAAMKGRKDSSSEVDAGKRRTKCSEA